MEENTQEDLTTLDTVNEVPAVPVRKSLVRTFMSLKLVRPTYNSSGVDKLEAKVVSTVDGDKVKEVAKSLADKGYSPVAKDKLYFYPECTVPRFKVREMWKPNKVSITIKEDNASHKFLCSNYNKYLNNSSSHYRCKPEQVKLWLENNKTLFQTYNKEFLIENMSKEVVDALNGDEDLFLDWQFYYTIDGSYKTMNGKDSYGNDYNFPTKPNNDITQRSGHTTEFKDEKYAEAWEDAYNDPTEFYLDAAVNRALQDASTVIDGEMYEQLNNLLESEDTDNTTMAMEVIANSNIEKSAKFVYLLMKQHSAKMVYQKGYNSVNFKALRESTGLERYTRYDDDSYVRFLQKYGQADLDLVNTIRDECIKTAKRSLETLYSESIHSGAVTIDIPYVKVVVKGVNDGTQLRKIVDPVADTIEEVVEANPEHFVNQLVEVTPPCAAHDEASVEALKEEVVQEEIEELDQEDREMVEAGSELIEGVTEALEEISIIAPVIKAITPEPVDHNDDDADNVFAEGSFVEDPFGNDEEGAYDEDPFA